MTNKIRFLHVEEYKTILSFLFIFLFIVIQPFFKYSEYVLNAPRINFSLIIFIMFFSYILTTPRLLPKHVNYDLLFSFWILLFISGIQLLSSPWAMFYSLQGPEQYLKIISKTFFCYWMFWFSGIYIKNWISNKYIKLFFSWSWILGILLIFINSLQNENFFRVVLEGEQIYLMLADTFAILSIFALLYNKKYDIFIILLSAIALFALWSRASFYSFVILSIFYALKEHKFKLSFLILVMLLFFDKLLIFKDDRMLRILFGVFDVSQYSRQQLLSIGLKEINMVWLFGNFMGDVNSSFGKSGTYIHSYLSFLRQFGFFPFIAFITLGISSFIKIIKLWIHSDDLYINFIFYFSIFVFTEVLFARSFVFPYIWLSISAINVIHNNSNEYCK